MAKAVAARHLAHNKIKGALCHIEPGRLAKHLASVGERRDHQSVPVGEDLVVEAWTDACRARGEKLFARRQKPRLVRLAALLRLETIEDIVSFEISLRRDVVIAREEFAVFATELAEYFVVGPDVKLALLAFGIRIERSAERAACVCHLAREPGDGFLRALPVKRFLKMPMRDGEEFEQLRIVVKHFLEMRHQPAFVHRVAGKAAAEMIIDAAFADMVQRHIDGGEIARLPAAQSAAPQKLEQ